MKPSQISHSRSTIGFAGLQAVFTTFIGHGVSHFQNLGLRKTAIAIILLAGPVCGAIFQPYFGAWSDQCQSKWGRRKPFIIIGTMSMALAILCMAWADSIAYMFTATKHLGPYRMVLSVLTLLSTFVLWIAAQAVQVGMRALISDGHTASEQVKASGWAGFYSNLAAALGNFAAYMIDSNTEQLGEAFKSLSVLATVCLILTVYLSCSGVVDHDSTSTNKLDSRNTSFQTAKILLFQKAPQIRNICFVQFFAWGAWFPFLFYTKIYVTNKNEIIMKGFPIIQSSANTMAGSLTLLIYSAVSFCFGIILPYWASKTNAISLQYLWMISLGLLGGAMLATFFIFSTIMIVIIFGLVGFSWAVSAWIPYALLGAEACYIPSQDDDRFLNHEAAAEPRHYQELIDISDQVGLIYGIHNLSICLPQILIATGTGVVFLALRDTGNDSRPDFFDPVWSLRFGGVLAFIAMYIARNIRDPPEKRPEIDRETP